MIFDIVNAIIYVILAQLFCTAFLDREDIHPVVDVGVTFLWMLVSFGAGTIFEEYLIIRIIIVNVFGIVCALVLYKKKKLIMNIFIPNSPFP